MERIYIFLLFFSFVSFCSKAQNIGINTNSPDASAALHIAGTDKGMLIPSIALSGSNDQTTVVGAPYPTGLMVYNAATVAGANAISPGFYYWSGTEWARVVTTTDLVPDNSWYEVGTNRPADNITDNIYTSGRVSIGTTSPGTGYQLDVNGSIHANDNFILENSSSTGTQPFRIDGYQNNLYVIAEGGSGQPATSIRMRTAAAGTGAIDQIIIQADGDLEMQNDNIIHMPNNMVYMVDRGQTTRNGGLSYGAVSNTSSSLRVEAGNTIVVKVDWRAKFGDGSGTDDLNYRIVATGSNGCSTINGAILNYRPAERTDEHDNYMPYTFTDVFTISCSGNYTFRLDASTSGADDVLYVDDVVIIATIY